MTRIFAAALFAILAGTLAVHAMPTEVVASSATVQPAFQPSFDIAMPAPQEPVDATVITPVESVGAARTE